MNPKWNYILGATTIAVIIGGVTYSIIKAKRDEKAEEDAITLEEAKDIVAQGKGTEENEWGPDESINNIHTEEDTIKFVRPIKGSAIYEDIDEDIDEDAYEKIIDSMINDVEEYQDQLEREELYGDKYDPNYESTYEPKDYNVTPLIDFTYFEDGIDSKEDHTLRFNPNSDEARHQYVRMELAEWQPNHDVYRILIQLFEVPFVPTNHGDEMLRTQIIDHKVQFFGYDSKWVKEVSFSDVIFHYARETEFNCGDSVQYWVEYFLDFNEFEWDSPIRHIDELVNRLNSHTYFNEERQTFGLFGLNQNSMDQALSIASMNIDKKVTYSIEFNEFLKSII